MGGDCFKADKGDIYLASVARSAVNRVDALSSTNQNFRSLAQERFTNVASDSYMRDYKHDMTRVLIEPYAYSVWNPGYGRRSNWDPFRQALCPPAYMNNKRVDGDVFSNTDRAIWNHSLRYAIEAVLHPDVVKQRTPGFKYFEYTSGVQRDARLYDRVTSLNVRGNKYTQSECMMVWEEKKFRAPNNQTR